MTRPTDAAIAQLLDDVGQKLRMYYVATAGEYVGGVEHSELQRRIADMRAETVKVTTSPERVQIPAESEHVAPYGRCPPFMTGKYRKTFDADAMSAVVEKIACPIPTCRAELLPGQTCGGVNCGLRGKV